MVTQGGVHNDMHLWIYYAGLDVSSGKKKKKSIAMGVMINSCQTHIKQAMRKLLPPLLLCAPGLLHTAAQKNKASCCYEGWELTDWCDHWTAGQHKFNYIGSLGGIRNPAGWQLAKIKLKTEVG